MMSTRNELAAAYNLHPTTMSKRLKEIGLPSRKRLTPKEIKLVFEELGEPGD